MAGCTGMVWNGVVWKGVVWCEKERCGVEKWCGVEMRGVVWSVNERCGVVCCGKKWYGEETSGMTWFGIPWLGKVRCGEVRSLWRVMLLPWAFLIQIVKYYLPLRRKAPLEGFRAAQHHSSATCAVHLFLFPRSAERDDEFMP